MAHAAQVNSIIWRREKNYDTGLDEEFDELDTFAYSVLDTVAQFMIPELRHDQDSVLHNGASYLPCKHSDLELTSELSGEASSNLFWDTITGVFPSMATDPSMAADIEDTECDGDPNKLTENAVFPYETMISENGCPFLVRVVHGPEDTFRSTSACDPDKFDADYRTAISENGRPFLTREDPKPEDMFLPYITDEADSQESESCDDYPKSDLCDEDPNKTDLQETESEMMESDAFPYETVTSENGCSFLVRVEHRREDTSLPSKVLRSQTGCSRSAGDPDKFDSSDYRTMISENGRLFLTREEAPKR